MEYKKIPPALMIVTVVISILITGEIINLKHPPVWGSPEINENSRYLVSSIFQGLVAAFAMIFTFILIAVQLSYNYSELLIDKFFKLIDIGYLVLFLANAIWSLLIMDGIFITPFSFWKIYINMQKAIYINVVISVGLLLGLLPYFLYIKKRMSILYLANILKEECWKTILKFIKNNKNAETNKIIEEAEKNSIGPLFSIVLRLAEDRKYYLVLRILDIIEDLILKILKLAISIERENVKTFTQLIRIITRISYSINNVGENFIEDRFIIDATISSLVRINKMFIELILSNEIPDYWKNFLLYCKTNKNCKNSPLMKTTQMLEDIAWRASYKNLDYVINVVFSGIEELKKITEAIKTDKKEYKKDIIALMNGWHIIMGAYALYKDDKYMLNQALKILLTLTTEDIIRAEKWAKRIIYAHPRWVLDESTLNKFLEKLFFEKFKRV